MYTSVSIDEASKVYYLLFHILKIKFNVVGNIVDQCYQSLATPISILEKQQFY